MLLQLETFPEHVHHFTIKPFSLAGGGDPLESLITFYCELKFEIGYGKKLLSREGEWRVKLQTKVHTKVRNHREDPIRAFCWLKVLTSTYRFKTLLRHFVKQTLTPQ